MVLTQKTNMGIQASQNDEKYQTNFPLPAGSPDPIWLVWRVQYLPSPFYLSWQELPEPFHIWRSGTGNFLDKISGIVKES
jgi:hypothetical protein